MKYGAAVIRQDKARNISPIPIKKARLYRSAMYPIIGLNTIWLRLSAIKITAETFESKEYLQLFKSIKNK